MNKVELVEHIRSTIQRHIGPVQRATDGQLELAADSTVCRVGVVEQASGRTLVYVSAFILSGVPATPEVFRHVALHADDWVFGHLCSELEPDSDTLVLSMRHTLLGSTLDPEELVTAVIDLSAIANELDDQLQAIFGGRRWVD